MKLIRQSLSFERGQSPKFSMGVGKIAQIKAWLDEMRVKNYIINDDFTIDIKDDVNLSYNNLIKFLDFIKFGKIEGYFTCHGNHLITLKGCPYIVKYNFYCYNNQLTSLEDSPESVGLNFYCQNNITKFTKEDVQKVCQVKGDIII